MPDVPIRPLIRRGEEGNAVWFLGSLVTVKASGAETHGRVTVVEFLNPPGFAPPLHRHIHEDEMFYVLDGEAEFHCDGWTSVARPGDFVVLPAGLAHSFVVISDDPFRTLQITSPAGFEEFAAAGGQPAPQHRLPDAATIDPAALAHASALHGIELLGPPPTAVQRSSGNT